MKKPVLTKEAPAPIGPYSQAIAFKDFLFCSGQIPLDPSTNQLVSGGVKEQALQVLKNIKALLNAQQMDFSNVVKSTIFLTDMNDFATVNEVYAEFFKDPAPARSTFAVVGLPKQAKVEIEVIAAKF